MNLEKTGTARATARRNGLRQILEAAEKGEKEPAAITWPAWLPIVDPCEDDFEGWRPMSESVGGHVLSTTPAQVGDKCWVVWEVEWGGQIVATCPLDIVLKVDAIPRRSAASASRRLLREARRITGEDGCYCYGVVFHPDLLLSDIPETRLPGWIAQQYVPGGMGGGLLLENDLWLHSHTLGMGPAVVNRFRRFLGLSPVSLDGIVWSENDRLHAALCRGLYRA